MFHVGGSSTVEGLKHQTLVICFVHSFALLKALLRGAGAKSKTKENADSTCAEYKPVLKLEAQALQLL